MVDTSNYSVHGGVDARHAHTLFPCTEEGGARRWWAGLGTGPGGSPRCWASPRAKGSHFAIFFFLVFFFLFFPFMFVVVLF